MGAAQPGSAVDTAAHIVVSQIPFDRRCAT
jgi:hypothetical protein